MIKTLQLYITRELLKTFTLTAIGLALTFSLCGGVLNMLQAEVLTAVQMMRILTFVLPVSVTLTLPVAALFACASVYGRFAADNEFDACRASGINIQRLLAPALGLSVFTALFTFAFSNFVIPSFIERLEAIVRQDIQKIVSQSLTTRGYLRYGPYVLHARQTIPFDEGNGVKGLQIRQAAFIMLEKDTLSRCGTAGEVRVTFYPGRDGSSPTAEARMLDVTALDLVHNQLHLLPEQPFNPMQLPQNIRQNAKWLNLPDLYHYLKHPTEYLEIREDIAKTRSLVRDAMFYRWVVERLTSGERVLNFGDKNRSLSIKADRAANDDIDFRPSLNHIQLVEKWGNRRRDYKADSCAIRVKHGYGGKPDVVHVALAGRVTFIDSLDRGKVNERKQHELDDVPLPAEIAAMGRDISLADLAGVEGLEEGATLRYDRLAEKSLPSLRLGRRVDEARYGLLAGIVGTGLEIASTLHSRIAFSVSSLVTLVLAAALAIIFRGGQVLTAFVISFVPGLLVVVLNIMGRQLAGNPASYLPGLAVIWAGIGLLAVADVVVLTRYLRR